MKNLLVLIACLFFVLPANSQSFSTFGVVEKDDEARKIITTTDYGFVVAGQNSNNAILNKYTPQGQLSGSFEYDFPVGSSYEYFSDVVELDNQSYLAIGDASSLDGSLHHTFVARISATMAMVDWDTLLIFGKSSRGMQIEKAADGTILIAGIVSGAGFDFSDIYVVKINPNTLAIQDSITKFSYGVDEITALSFTNTGDLLVSGYSVLGNIFNANNNLTNIAWTRCITPQGVKKWETKRQVNILNKFGRQKNTFAIQHPQTQHILVGGCTYTGDTLNPMNGWVGLLDLDGNLLDEWTLNQPGSQVLNDVAIKPTPSGILFEVIGDSTSALTSFRSACSTILLSESNQQIEMEQYISNNMLIKPLSMVITSNNTTAYCGITYLAPFVTGNADGIVYFPALPQEDPVVLFFTISDTICSNTPFIGAVINDATSYQWTFGDGTTFNDRFPNKTFTTPGTYTANLSVTLPPNRTLVTNIQINSHDSYFSLPDPFPDLYLDIKNNSGNIIYRTGEHYDISQSELPYDIPCAIHVTPDFHIAEIWDFDFFDADDFLGEVYIANMSQAGTYSTGNASITTTTIPAATTYNYSVTVTVIAPYITMVNDTLFANIDMTGLFSYNWYKDGLLISNANGPVYVPTEPGCYTCRLLGSGTCNETSAPYCYNTSETNTVEGTPVLAKTYPNPVEKNTDFNLELPQNEQEAGQLVVMDPLGRTLYEANIAPKQKLVSIPASEWQASAGTYWVRVFFSNGSEVSMPISIW